MDRIPSNAPMIGPHVPWLVAATEDSTSLGRLTEPMPTGTVVSFPRGGTQYTRHDPNGLDPARGVVYRLLRDGGALIVAREATVIAALLNDGRGLALSTKCDLQMVGIRVLP
jgi:hypothetical protein